MSNPRKIPTFVKGLRFAALLALGTGPAFATSFTAGNVVVEQADVASSQNTTIHIVEVNSSTANQASPVQSIALPGTNYPTQALRINGSGGTTGYAANSNDGTLFAVADANAGSSSDLPPTNTGSAATILPRAVVTFNQAGTLALPTTYTGASGNQCRGATTLDNSTWYIADKGGIYTNGGTSPHDTANILGVKSYGGTVYVITAAAPGVSTIATPTSTSLTALSGFSVANLQDFSLISSGVNGTTFDVMYCTTNTSATSGTISKYSLVGGNWTANGSYSTNFGGCRLAAAGSGTGATLFVTSGDGTVSGNKVLKLTDTAPYNTTLAINTANNVTLYTLATGTTAKGIAFAPLATALPDLTVNVTAPATGITGQNFNYTLTVANSGTANATGVAVNFTLPAGLTYVSSSDDGGDGFSAVNNSGVISFTGGTLNHNSSDALTVTVSAASGGAYTAAAGAAVIDPSNTIAESNENNNSSTVAATTTIGTIADLTVDVTGGPTSVTANTNFNYTLTVQNIGTASASGIPVQFTIPAGLAFVSAADNGSGGFTAPNSAPGGVVSFTGGTLAAGGTDTLTVTVSSAATGTFTLPAGAAVVDSAHTIQESNYSNNSSTSVITTTVTAPDLVVSITHNDSFAPGDTGDTYSVYVSNEGSAPTNGTAATVTITLPSGLTPTAASGSGWSAPISGQTVTATRSDVLAAGSAYPVLTITVSVASNASGNYATSVSATGGGNVSVANNNITGTVAVAAIPSAITVPGNLLVSKSVYTGTAATVAYPGTLPNGSPSTTNGSYPGVWGNESPDAAFGVTAPVYIDQITKSGTYVNTINVTNAISSQLGLNVSTSFSSKSELALNPTPDGSGLTFMCYVAAPNTLDVSNTDTPYHVDPTNPITSIGAYQRAVVQMDYLGNVKVTPVNAYSGNNGRAAVLANGPDGNPYYFMVGNAGNGSGNGSILSMLSDNTGVQMITPGAGGNSTAVGEVWGAYGSSTGYQHGFSLANVPGDSADKTGKDMNLRGLTVNPYNNNTLYVCKGSGGNGVNTVYQVGTGTPDAANAGSLPITILPGFSTNSSAGTGAQVYPFGLWFANANTLYVADEGVPSTATTYNTGTNQYTSALPANNPTAGLQKWTFDGTKWNLVYTLQNGLNLGIPYSVANGADSSSYPTGNNPATGLPWAPAANGLRNITGQVNGDGTVTIYAVTSTASGETDQGADPNQLVAITDTISATSSGSESFTLLKSAVNKEVLRGVTLSPAATSLHLDLSHSGTFTQGDGYDVLTASVSNFGNVSTGGTVTVSGTLPADLVPLASNNGTINGWSVSVSGQTVTATRSDSISGSTAYPSLPLAVSVSASAAASDSYTLAASGGGAANTAYATDTISIATNEGLSYAGFSASTDYQTAVTLSIAKLLGQATDLNSATVSVTAVGSSVHGGAVQISGSTIIYTPPSGFSGADSFPVTLTDTTGASTTGIVTVTAGSASASSTGGQGVNPPTIVMSGGTAIVTFQGIPGRSYLVQRSSDLANWATQTTVVAGTNGTVSYTDTNPPSPSAFYRIYQP